MHELFQPSTKLAPVDVDDDVDVDVDVFLHRIAFYCSGFLLD